LDRDADGLIERDLLGRRTSWFRAGHKFAKFRADVLWRYQTVADRLGEVIAASRDWRQRSATRLHADERVHDRLIVELAARRVVTD
jgi:hypothetical protein